MNHNFSFNLKRLREISGFTQETFAQATGLKRNTIACYETERRECDFNTLLLFAKVLNCSTDDLLKSSDKTDEAVKKRDKFNRRYKRGYLYFNKSFFQ